LSAGVRKGISILLKLAFCGGAIWYLCGKVYLNDYARLADAPQMEYRVVGRDADSLRIMDPDTGAERSVPLSALAAQDQLEKGQRPFELGLKSIVREADHTWTLWALIVYGPVAFGIAWRLQCLLATQDIPISYRDAALLTLAGNFFNFAMPGTTGGDLYKAYHIARLTHRRTEGITIIFLDRAIGLVSFLLLAALTIFASWRTDIIGPYGRWVGYLMLAVILGFMLFFSRRVRAAVRYERLLEMLPFADKIKRIDQTTFSFRYHRGQAIFSLVITVVTHFLIVGMVFCMAHSLGIDPAKTGRDEWELYRACLLATVVGYLFAAVPITIQGFGLLEAVFYKVLVDGNWCNPSQMLALTLATRLVQIAWSLPGVIVPWLGFHRPQAAELSTAESA